MEDFEMSCLVQFFKGQSKALRTALFVVAFLSGVAFGQVNSGQLIGKVYDPNGARVPGAIVQVKSEETGLERLATTSDEGLFVITNLPPGIYEVGVQAQGFAVMTRRVRVFVGSAVRVDSQLSVTPVVVPEEIVEGSGGVKINTQTGQLSDPVSGRQLRELPVITRDPYSLVTLSGNVTPFRINPLGVAPITGGFGFSAFPFPIVNTEPDQDFAIDGQPPTFNNVQVDGGENIVNYWSTLGQRMPLEGVQEINVITNGFRPEFGRLGGGLINVATRPGGSYWRGSLFEFYRGDALNATSFEANALGIRKGHLVGNNFGGAIGGPVIDDKLYFFVSGEGIRVRSREDRVALVPDPILLGLSTPATVPGSTGATPVFFGAFPLGSVATVNGALRTTPVTTVGAFTFADTVSLLGGPGAFPAGSPFLALATTPAFAGLPAFDRVLFNVNTNIGGGLPQDTALAVGRFDWTKSDRSLIYGRYAYFGRDIFRGALSFSPFAGFNTGFHELDHNAQINWLYTFSGPDCCSSPGASPWLMNLKANYNRVNLRRNNDFNTAVAPRLAATPFAFPNIGGFPLAFPGDFPFDANLNSLITGPLNLLQASADFAGAWRGHQLQFGGSYYYFQDNRNIFSFQNGLFTLGQDVPTALDSLVLGTANSFSVAINPFGAVPGSVITTPPVQPDFNRSLSNHDFSLYGSFNWRVTSNFNLLLGLRYDFFNLPRSRNDEIFFNFFPGAGTTVPAQVASGVFAPPGTFTGAALADTRVDNNRRFFHRDSDNIAPRIGFAWDFTGGGAGCCTGLRRSTTLRGSVGLTYERLFYAVSPFFQENATFGIPSLVAGTPLAGTGTTIAPIPLIAPGAVGPSTFGPLGVPGTAVLPNFLVRGIDRDIEAPRITFWTVALDREIALNTVASLQYAGAHGHDLFTVSNINRPGSALGFLTPPTAVPLARLNPGLGPVFFLRSNGRSNYNAFIADLTNSTWRTIGLSFTARYRFAKALDNVNPFINENFNVGLLTSPFATNFLSPFDPENDYGPSDFDVRHRFIGSFIWELPDFFDRSCCGGNGGWKRWLLGGWAVTGIFQAMTGFPFTVFDCAGALTPETPCPRALVASGVNLDDIRTGQGSVVPDTTVPNRFNFIPASNFAVAPTTTVFPPFTGLGPTVGRNFFRGPGFWNFDFGVYKRFRFSEDTSFQLRGEFYNIFNHANLFVPSAVDINSTNFVPAFKRGGRIVQVGGKLYF
jgi:Carboxypeptidase regulatory-like domain/TonB dependent receptor-like, beta-barrel